MNSIALISRTIFVEGYESEGTCIEAMDGVVETVYDLNGRRIVDTEYLEHVIFIVTGMNLKNVIKTLLSCRYRQEMLYLYLKMVKNLPIMFFRNLKSFYI